MIFGKDRSGHGAQTGMSVMLARDLTHQGLSTP
jgi:hypothetical protein